MRYETVENKVYELLNSVIHENFEELKGVEFEVIYDTKKKTKGNKIIAAYIKKTNDLISYLSENEFQYMIFLNKDIWNSVEEIDRFRILRHELFHVFIDANHDDVRYNLKDHDFEAFKTEIEIESKEGGDPLWMERIYEIADAIYNDDKDEE